MLELISNHWPIALAIVVTVLALALSWDEWEKRTALEKRFSVIVDADAEARQIVRKAKAYAQKLVTEASASQAAALAEAEKLRAETTTLRSQYAEKRAVYDRLLKEVAAFDERVRQAHEVSVPNPR